jgi:hypothetical protein
MPGTERGGLALLDRFPERLHKEHGAQGHHRATGPSSRVWASGRGRLPAVAKSVPLQLRPQLEAAGRPIRSRLTTGGDESIASTQRSKDIVMHGLVGGMGVFFSNPRAQRNPTGSAALGFIVCECNVPAAGQSPSWAGWHGGLLCQLSSLKHDTYHRASIREK